MAQFFTKKILVILSLLSVCVVGSGILAWRLRDDCNLRLPTDGCVQLDYATTPEARAQGLSGRDQLGIGHGMLFSFTSPGKQCFWMKDMRFSIDMIWLDANNKIVTIKPNASPESYPESFCPTGDATQVLELPAGSAERNGLTVGNTLML